MGALKEKLKNKNVYFDANIFIYLLEDNKCLETAISEIKELIKENNIIIYSSSLSYAEVLPPYAENIDEIQSVVGFLNLFNIVNIDKNIYIDAGILRGKTKILTPDAIHVASAMNIGCDIFLTNDKKISMPENIEKVIISEYTK